MVGLYDILFILLCFGLITGAVNELGIFEMKVPTSGFTISNSTVTEIQEGALSQTANDFSVWEVIQSFMRVIGSGLVALFAIGVLVYGMFNTVGAAPEICLMAAGLVQAPVTFVTLFGLYEWWTGRSLT
jgi:hypothetical protein